MLLMLILLILLMNSFWFVFFFYTRRFAARCSLVVLGCSLGLFVLGRSLVVLGMEHLVDKLKALLVEKVMTRNKVMTRKNCMMTMMVYYWKKDSMMKNRLMTIYYWKKDSTN
jgi:hypothetical protein